MSLAFGEVAITSSSILLGTSSLQAQLSFWSGSRRLPYDSLHLHKPCPRCVSGTGFVPNHCLHFRQSLLRGHGHFLSLRVNREISLENFIIRLPRFDTFSIPSLSQDESGGALDKLEYVVVTLLSEHSRKYDCTHEWVIDP